MEPSDNLALLPCLVSHAFGGTYELSAKISWSGIDSRAAANQNGGNRLFELLLALEKTKIVFMTISFLITDTH